MKQLFLKKVIIISFFISIVILLDFFSFLQIFKIYFFSNLFKLPLIVIFLGGVLLGFKSVFFISLFYSFWHFSRSFASFFAFAESLNLNHKEIWLSIFLDYFLSDWVLNISGFCFVKKRDSLNTKKIFFLFLIVCLVRMFFLFLSTCFIYAPAILSHGTKLPFLEQNIMLFSFIYSFVPFVVNFVFSIFCLLKLLPSFRYLLESLE
ncbi:hypothetical protein ['Camptotheca acuminata' phytoplasma]|uniref:hypothetical protein n=1 Tax='Camptotheca acuminata' phytoplasma TaxID=3239192 RepID=UPI00351A6771